MFVLFYNQIEYPLSNGDATRLEALYSGGKPFGPQFFTFSPYGKGGTVMITVGTGIALSLHSGDD